MSYYFIVAEGGMYHNLDKLHTRAFFRAAITISYTPMARIGAFGAARKNGFSVALVAQVFFDVLKRKWILMNYQDLAYMYLYTYLTRAQSCPQVTGVTVGRVLRVAVQVLHHPIEASAEIVFSPTLDVVEVELLRPLSFVLGSSDGDAATP